MDDLELLKKDWQQEKANEFHQYTENELFAMTKQKSVSVAKWVFIIGFLEILFWFGVDYGVSYWLVDEETKPSNILHNIYDIMVWIFKIIPYIFLSTLIYLHYKIKNTNSSQLLMKKIMWMRKAIIWNINAFLTHIVVGFSFGFFSGMIESQCESEKNINIMVEWFVNIFLFIILIFILFSFVIFFKKIYYLIYGRFIKQLEENYKELSKIEE